MDKWLWSIRLYRTRTAAGEACRAGHVQVNGDRVKASSSVRVGDTVEARVNGWARKVEVANVF